MSSADYLGPLFPSQEWWVLTGYSTHLSEVSGEIRNGTNPRKSSSVRSWICSLVGIPLTQLVYVSHCRPYTVHCVLSYTGFGLTYFLSNVLHKLWMKTLNGELLIIYVFIWRRGEEVVVLGSIGPFPYNLIFVNGNKEWKNYKMRERLRREGWGGWRERTVDGGVRKGARPRERLISQQYNVTKTWVLYLKTDIVR